MGSLFVLWLLCYLLPFVVESQEVLKESADLGCGKNLRGDKWPWLVSLGTNETSKFVHLCSGALITHQWVLTAANCFEKDGTEDYTSLWRMTFGEKKDEYFSEAFKVEQIVKPKVRNEEEFGNDIALVKLERSLNSSVVCLPGDGSISTGDQLVLAGWTGSSKDEFKISLMDNGQCVLKYLDKNKKKHETDEKQLKQMFCGKPQQTEKCEGFAGGPLMKSDEGIWKVVGIFSIAISCGSEGLYTDVSNYLQWIKSVIG